MADDIPFFEPENGDDDSKACFELYIRVSIDIMAGYCIKVTLLAALQQVGLERFRVKST